MIAHDGLLYVNLTGNNDETLTPDQNTTDWSEYVISRTKIPDFADVDPNDISVGDIVYDSDGNGVLVPYISRVDNPTSSPYEDLSDGDDTNNQWDAISAANNNLYEVPDITDYIGYTPGARYNQNDLVAYRGKMYVNLTGSYDPTLTPETDTQNWQEYSLFTGTAEATRAILWDSDTTYAADDIVISSEGITYISVTGNGNLNQNPDNDATNSFWRPANVGETAGRWDSVPDYKLWC